MQPQEIHVLSNYDSSGGTRECKMLAIRAPEQTRVSGGCHVDATTP
jgi:hypothetical protein